MEAKGRVDSEQPATTPAGSLPQPRRLVLLLFNFFFVIILSGSVLFVVVFFFFPRVCRSAGSFGMSGYSGWPSEEGEPGVPRDAPAAAAEPGTAGRWVGAEDRPTPPPLHTPPETVRSLKVLRCPQCFVGTT